MNKKQWARGMKIFLGGTLGYVSPNIDPEVAGLTMGVGAIMALSATEYPQQLLSEALEKGELAPKEA